MKISLEVAQNAKEQQLIIQLYYTTQGNKPTQRDLRWHTTETPVCLCYTALLMLALSQSQLLCPLAEEWTKKNIV